MRKFTVSLVTFLATAVTAHGHGDQIQITFNPATGKIETREIVHSGTRPGAISDAKRVYVMPMLPLAGGAGDGWYVRPNDARNAFNVPLFPTGPGLNYQYDPSQLPGSGWSFSGSASLPDLQGSNFGYQFAAALMQWNGATFVDPGAEQLQMFRGDGTSVPSILAESSDGGPFESLALSTINSMSGNPHHSVGFRLLGDGVSHALGGPAAGDDGIYLSSFIATSTAAGVGASDPFYFVMHKNSDIQSAFEAAASLGFAESQVQVIPEPSMVGLLALRLGMLAARKRRS